MLSLDRLPNEVLHGIASFLHKKYDLAALSRVNRLCHDIANPILWKREVKSDRPGALHWAVEHQDIKLLRRALEAGVDPCRIAYTHRPKPRIESRHKWWNYHSSYYDDPEWRLDDDDESVDLDVSYVLHDHCDCFESGCDDGIFSDCRWEAIHVAASKGRIDMIDLLLEKGATIDAASWGLCLCRPHLPIEAFSESRAVEEDELADLHGGNWTPLHVAICHNQIETAKFLLRRGASNVIYQGINIELDLNAWQVDNVPGDASRFRLTAMHHAAKHDQPELLQFLLDEKYQEDVDTEGLFMGTPLFQGIWYGHWDTTIPWLLKNGANIDTRLIETRLTPLMMACFSRRFDDAARLLDLGADVNTLSVHSFSILHLILGPGQVRPDEFADPLDLPRHRSKITEAEIITRFIDRGFNVDAQEALLGMTPLMVASASCNLSALKALLDGGADVNALDHDGLTALGRLGEAVEGSAVTSLCEAGKLLIDAGAKLDSMQDMTPLNIICSRRCEPYFSRDWDSQHAQLAKLLIKRGADPNEKGTATKVPFTEAVMHGNLSLAQAILDGGGRPEKRDVEELLEKSVHDPYDDGKTDFVLGLDYHKYGMTRPSDALLVCLLNIALREHLWSRAADLMKAVPTPKYMRKGLLHRCLSDSSLRSDDPSALVQVLLDQGEDPNELFQDEPPLYHSLRSGVCWRTTPVLINGGADVHLPTKAMPDGAFMYTIAQRYHPQAMQMLAKHPDMLQDKPERLHQACWESVFRLDIEVLSMPRGNEDEPPILMNWNIVRRLMGAGLRTDVKMMDGTDVKELVEKAIPKTYPLGIEAQKVLDDFDIPYVEPEFGDDEDDEDEECSEASDEIDDDYSEAGSIYDEGYYHQRYNGHPFDFDTEGEEEEEDEDEAWYGAYHNGDFDDEEEDDDENDEDDLGPFPIPLPASLPLLFGFFM